MKELLKRVEADKEDKTAKDLARVLFETATLRSGYMIKVKRVKVPVRYYAVHECVRVIERVSE